MASKILPKANSVYTNASAEAFASQTQNNARAENDFKKLGINANKAYVERPTLNSPPNSRNINHDGAHILMSPDSPTGPGTGYGALGTPSSSIRLLCKPGAAIPDASRNSSIFLNNNFQNDAATIYLSETTDLEDNFSMPQGDNIREKARSGFGAQADVIALKGRGGVTIATGQFGDRNSKGGKMRSGRGIELIAGTNSKNLQPLVLGDNLQNSLKTIYERLNRLTFAVMDLTQVQNDVIEVLKAHTHQVALTPAGLTASFSTELNIALPFKSADNTIKGIMNSTCLAFDLLADELNNLTALGSDYINSDLNRTN